MHFVIARSRIARRLRLASRVPNVVMDWAAKRLLGPFPHVGHAGARLRYQRLPSLRRPFYRLLRRRSVWVIGICCTRPLCQGACVRSEQLATVPSGAVSLSRSPTTLSCRDLLHSAQVSGRLCQVRAARHCSVRDSELEPLTDDLQMSGPVALGPSLWALVSGQSSSPLILPGLRA